MYLKTSLIPGVLFPGIPALNSRETGMPKIREFPGISRPGIPGRQHYTNLIPSPLSTLGVVSIQNCQKKLAGFSNSDNCETAQ